MNEFRAKNTTFNFNYSWHYYFFIYKKNMRIDKCTFVDSIYFSKNIYIETVKKHKSRKMLL